MSTTISSFLAIIKKELQSCSPDLFNREAETIFEHVLSLSRNALYLNSSKKISETDQIRIKEIVSKRLSGKPLQYSIGEVFFYSANFKVDENVLIPRPDTETLIETVLQNESSDSLLFADIGTGSGIIAQTLLLEREKYKAIAVDISYKAAITASKNICSRGMILCSDKLESLKALNQFDFIVSNPPYITTEEMGHLEHSVINFEPHTALWGGEDGLNFYRHFSQNLRRYLKVKGKVYFEIGYLQAKDVEKILINDGWKSIEVIKDLAGRDRVIKAEI